MAQRYVWHVEERRPEEACQSGGHHLTVRAIGSMMSACHPKGSPNDPIDPGSRPKYLPQATREEEGLERATDECHGYIA